ncbi:ester cyclase [Arthrobacter sp. UYCu723]
MTRDANIHAQERFGAAANSRRLDHLDVVVAAACVDHDPAPEQGPGPQGFKDLFTGRRASFPDLNIAVEHLTATDDDVALAYVVTGLAPQP